MCAKSISRGTIYKIKLYQLINPKGNNIHQSDSQQKMNNEIFELVKQALFVQDPVLRAQGESNLLRLRDNQFEGFLIECSNHLANNQNDISLRQAFYTILKRSLTPDALQLNGQIQHSNWMTCQPQNREYVKSQLLNLLITNELTIQRAASDLVATIFIQEMSFSGWPLLIQSLIMSLFDPNIQVLTGALLALGNIIEASVRNIQDQKQFNCLNTISINEREQILNSICQILQNDFIDIKTREIGFQTLKVIVSIKSNKISNEAIQTILRTIFIYLQPNALLQIALETLIEIAQSLQSIVWNHLNEFIQVLFPILRIQDTNIVVLLQEVLSTFFQTIERKIQHTNKQNSHLEYTALIQQYQFITSGFVPELIATLLNQLMINDDCDDSDEEDEESKKSIQQGAFLVLQNLLIFLSLDNLNIVTQFIQTHSQQKSWRKRRAAILAFGSLLLYHDQSFVQNIIIQSLESIILSLEDKNTQVQLSAAKIILLSIENHRDVIMMSQNVLYIVNILMSQLNQPQLKKQLYIIESICVLLEALPLYKQSPLNAITLEMLKALINHTISNMITPQYVRIIHLCFVGAQNIVQQLTEMQLLHQLTIEFKTQLDQQLISESWRQEAMKQGLISVLQTCFIRIHSFGINMSNNGPFPPDFFTQVYQSSTNYIIQIQEVKTEVFFLVGSICRLAGPNFYYHAEGFIQTYVWQTLLRHDDREKFLAAVQCASDIIRAYSDQVTLGSKILIYLLSLLKDYKLDPEAQINILDFAVDFIHTKTTLSFQHIDIVLEAFHTKITNFTFNNDDETQQLELLNSLLNGLINILSDVQDCEPIASQIYEAYKIIILNFEDILEQTESIEVHKTIFTVICDFMNVYKLTQKQEMAKFIDSQFINKIGHKIQSLCKNDQQCNDLIEYFILLKAKM